MLSATLSFRDRGAAQAGGYVLAAAAVLVCIGLFFHPVPAGGFEERPSILQNTPGGVVVADSKWTATPVEQMLTSSLAPLTMGQVYDAIVYHGDVVIASLVRT